MDGRLILESLKSCKMSSVQRLEAHWVFRAKHRVKLLIKSSVCSEVTFFRQPSTKLYHWSPVWHASVMNKIA